MNELKKRNWQRDYGKIRRNLIEGLPICRNVPGESQQIDFPDFFATIEISNALADTSCKLSTALY
jgi:hypothetical protein